MLDVLPYGWTAARGVIRDPAEIAEEVGAPTTSFSPKGSVSSRFHWFADADRLCVIASKEAIDVGTSDMGFSHALGHLGDRDLILVLPPEGAEAASHRLPFLDIPARCWSIASNEVRLVDPLRQSDVLKIDRYHGLRGGSHDLSAGLDLVAPLRAWLDEQAGFIVDDRKSYRTWQYKGRQVLTLRMAGSSEIDVVAGVNYSDPAPGSEPVKLRLKSVITVRELQRVTAAIEAARLGKDAGYDKANAEHLLQERLRADWKALALRGAPLRELPVRRPVGYGYIDLVGVGDSGSIQLIETKLGPFDRLVVQGLDYWIWANANRDDLAELLEQPPDAPIEIDYVVAEKTPGRGVIGSYTSGQAEALHGQIRWRFTTVRAWMGSGPMDVDRLPLRTLPSGAKGRPAPRKAAMRWPIRVANHLADRAVLDGVSLRGGVFWPNAIDGLEPAAASVYETLAADGLAHHMIGHIRSSQAFALNLFAPLNSAARRRVARLLGVEAREVSEAYFEWSDPEDLLGERTQASPHATQVDVRLDCLASDGATVGCLIEVKLSEMDFNHCSAWLSDRNDRRDVCATDGPFGNSPTACFQLRNHDREARRKYDTALGHLPLSADRTRSGCWFRFGGNQVMRNAALARTLISRGAADRAVVALCAPNGHHAIWRRWAEASGKLHLDGVQFVNLRADDVVQHHPNGALMSQRYLLEKS